MKLPDNQLMPEIIQRASNAKTRDEKIEILRHYDTPALRAVLIWNFDNRVECVFPEGEVPYTPNDAPIGTEHTVLEKEYRRLYLLFKCGSSYLIPAQRENLFIQMLEGLHQDEANVLILIKDKALGKKYKITRACVEEAFPQITWGGRS
jgi:hypothetical protein